MPRGYGISVNATNTQSATLPLMNFVGAATIRTEVYEMIFGSDATPGDQAAKYVMQRCSTAGTPGSSPVAQPLDPADPAAITTIGLAVFGAGPTLTASTFIWQLALNQRSSFRWVAVPGKELKIPATAANGLALMPTVVTSAFNTDFYAAFVE